MNFWRRLAFFSGVAAWLWTWRDVYFAGDRLVSRDNINFMYPMFAYVVKYLAAFHEWPAWIDAKVGGVWIEVVANNYLLLAPHRFLGYALAAWAGVPAITAYKTALLAGEAVFVYGLHRLARELFASSERALFFIAIALLTGVTLVFVQAEQMLGTLFFIPYLWLAALRERWVRFASLLGISLNVHYPQLIVLYGAVIVVADAISTRFLWRAWRRLRARDGCRALAALIIGASPVLYSYLVFHDRLQSPYRGEEGVGVASYADYETLNSDERGYCKLAPRNLRLFFDVTAARAPMGPLDELALAVTPAIPLLVILFLFFAFPHRRFHAVAIGGLLVLAMGTFTPLPRLLWYVLPGIRLFRQWYSFVPLAAAHLLFALFFAFDGFAAVDGRTRRRIGAALLLTGWIAGFVPALSALPGALLFAAPPRARTRNMIFGFWLLGGSWLQALYVMRAYTGFLRVVPYDLTPMLIVFPRELVTHLDPLPWRMLVIVMWMPFVLTLVDRRPAFPYRGWKWKNMPIPPEIPS